MELALRRAAGHSDCEGQGRATNLDVIGDGRVIEQAAWSCENPTPAF